MLYNNDSNLLYSYLKRSVLHFALTDFLVFLDRAKIWNVIKIEFKRRLIYSADFDIVVLLSHYRDQYQNLNVLLT